MYRALTCTFFLFISSLSCAEEILEKALKNQPTREFLLNMLSFYWKRSHLPQERLEDIFNILEKYALESELAMLLLHEKYPDMAENSSIFSERYRQARANKFDAYAGLIASYVQGEVLLDFGAENLQLASALTRFNSHIKKAYATDIFPCTASSNDPKVAFILQDSPTKTPLFKDSVDTIVLSTVLHHIKPAPRRELLAHLFEILKPGGRVILVEDSFSANNRVVQLYPKVPGESLQEIPEGEMEKAFFALSREEKQLVLAFLDWWGNRVMKNRAEIPLPYTFKTEEAWVDLFEDFDFKQVETHFFGFPLIDTHMVSPKSLMVFKKPVSTDSTVDTVFAPFLKRGDAIFETHSSLPTQGILLHVSVGGSKILVEGIDSQGQSVYRGAPFKWRAAPCQDEKRKWMIKQLLKEIEGGIQACGMDQVEQIILSWAGPVFQERRVVGPNIAGFSFADLTEEEIVSEGVDLHDLLIKGLSVPISISIINDADDEALAEFLSKGILDGTLLIIGTGVGAGFVMKGKPYFGPSNFVSRVGEIGHHVVFNQETSSYEYYGKASRGRILNEKKDSLTERLSGPALARRFLHLALRETGRELKRLLTYLNERKALFLEDEVALFFKEGQCSYYFEERVLKEISEKAKLGDERALRFIRATGFEIGAALAAFAEHFPEAPFLQRIHLAGSAGYFFGRDEEEKNDLFLNAIKKGFIKKTKVEMALEQRKQREERELNLKQNAA